MIGGEIALKRTKNTASSRVVEDGIVLTNLADRQCLLYMLGNRIHDRSRAGTEATINHGTVQANRLKEGLLHSRVDDRAECVSVATESCGDSFLIDTAKEINRRHLLLESLQLLSAKGDNISFKRSSLLVATLTVVSILPNGQVVVERRSRLLTGSSLLLLTGASSLVVLLLVLPLLLTSFVGLALLTLADTSLNLIILLLALANTGLGLIRALD
jgi:hypothetical protein